MSDLGFQAGSDGRLAFDPEPYRDDLLAIIREVEALTEVDEPALNNILRRHPRDGRGFFSRAQVIAGFRHFEGEAQFASRQEDFVRRIAMRPVRSQSGVTPVTVLTKPFPCPGRCIFCPNDVRMPKSYLSDEPGAQRAANNRFDPYLQTWNRLAAFRDIGHPTEKIELIILGGTWSFYPEAYQVGFIARCIEAMNDFGEGIDRRDEAVPDPRDFSTLPRLVDGRSGSPEIYNRTISRFLGPEPVANFECAEWSNLEQAHHRNEEAGSRCVGLSVETRPDHVTQEEVLRLRRLGCTKIQIGIQSLSDSILEANKRGHSVETTRTALSWLRAAGFKIHAHWMPNLLGATPESDVEEFAQLFSDPDFRPDELKVYPCSLIESAELMSHYESGAWRPYDHEELLFVVSEALRRSPRWCRLTRVIRDISSDDIVVGNKLTNFREIAQSRLEEEGKVVQDIRAREIRGSEFDPEALTLRESVYESSVGQEKFLEFVTPEDRIVGFLRLHLPFGGARVWAPEEISGFAVIREVHIYGAALDLGVRSAEKAQHRGLGRRLVGAAAERSAAAGFSTLSVVSAVGTRGYYRSLGFADGKLYQHLSLEAPAVGSEGVTQS